MVPCPYLWDSPPHIDLTGDDDDDD
jgi:hypothetical protein